MDLLLTPHWVGDLCATTEVETPSWDAIEAAIRALDGDQLNDVYLIPQASNREVWLCVGGGSGRYIVTGATTDERFATVIDPSRLPSQSEQLMVGGQVGDYPAQMIVSLETALRASRGFYETMQFTAEDVLWVTE